MLSTHTDHTGRVSPHCESSCASSSYQLLWGSGYTGCMGTCWQWPWLWFVVDWLIDGWCHILKLAHYISVLSTFEKPVVGVKLYKITFPFFIFPFFIRHEHMNIMHYFTKFQTYTLTIFFFFFLIYLVCYPKLKIPRRRILFIQEVI